MSFQSNAEGTPTINISMEVEQEVVLPLDYFGAVELQENMFIFLVD